MVDAVVVVDVNDLLGFLSGNLQQRNSKLILEFFFSYNIFLKIMSGNRENGKHESHKFL